MLLILFKRCCFTQCRRINDQPTHIKGKWLWYVILPFCLPNWLPFLEVVQTLTHTYYARRRRSGEARAISVNANAWNAVWSNSRVGRLLLCLLPLSCLPLLVFGSETCYSTGDESQPLFCSRFCGRLNYIKYFDRKENSWAPHSLWVATWQNEWFEVNTRFTRSPIFLPKPGIFYATFKQHVLWAYFGAKKEGMNNILALF